MPSIRLRDGVRLAFTEAGARSPLVFLHGVGSTSRTWSPQLAALQDEWRCLAVDLRGSGASVAPAEGISIEAMAADVAELVARQGARAHVCGLSLGGIVALRLAADHPCAVRSLVLADAWAHHPEAAASLAARLAAIDSVDMPTLARQRMPLVYSPTAPPELVERGIREMAAKDRACYRRSNEILWAVDCRAEAAALRVPTLVLVGEADRVTPPALSVELQRLVPGSRLLVIPSAGHLSNEERPEAFNAALRSFLRQVEGR